MLENRLKIQQLGTGDKVEILNEIIDFGKRPLADKLTVLKIY